MAVTKAGHGLIDKNDFTGDVFFAGLFQLFQVGKSDDFCLKATRWRGTRATQGSDGQLVWKGRGNFGLLVTAYPAGKGHRFGVDAIKAKPLQCGLRPCNGARIIGAAAQARPDFGG